MTDIERAIGHLQRISQAIDRAAQECHGLNQVMSACKIATPAERHELEYASKQMADSVAKLMTHALMGKLRAQS